VLVEGVTLPALQDNDALLSNSYRIDSQDNIAEQRRQLYQRQWQHQWIKNNARWY